MKRIETYLIGLMLCGLAASCSHDDKIDNAETNGTPTALTISVKSQDPVSRAVIQNPGSTEESPSQKDENTINTFTVYVYSAQSNILEAKKTFNYTTDINDGKFLINDLITGNKKVVVLANEPAITVGAINTEYSNFTTAMFNLSSQQTSNSLAMSGEGTVNLTAIPANNTISVTLTRVVAKIRLASVSVAPETSHPDFTPTKVHIMKARGEANYGVPRNYISRLDVNTSSTFYGGIAGDVSITPQTFLSEDIEMTANQSTNVPYFYIFPNDDTDGNSTLIVIEGYVNSEPGTPKYFPFRIRTATTGDNIGYIKRNDHYTIDVVIKRTADGVSNPEELVDPTALNVTVSVENWNDVNPDPLEW